MENTKKMSTIEFDEARSIDVDSFIMDLNVNQKLKPKGATASKIKSMFISSRGAMVEFNAKRPLLFYSLKRIFFSLLTLIVAISIIFLLLIMVTPDTTYVSDLTDKSPIKPGTEEYYNLIANRKKSVGLTGSVFNQIWNYFYNILPFFEKNITIIDLNEGTPTGQVLTTRMFFGVVFTNSFGQPFVSNVGDLFAKAMPISFAFGFTALSLTYIIGIPLGITAAKNKGKWIDNVLNGSSATLICVPPLVIVMLLFIFFSKITGVSTIYTPGDIGTFMVPVFVIVVMYIPTVIVETRRYIVDEMTSDYTKFAESKGMKPGRVFYIHIFRNAGIRIIRTIPIALVATIFGSSIFTEQQWSIPGMSRFIVGGVAQREIFVVLGYISIASFFGVITSLISDLLMAIMDPRVKLT
ncbi:oligopeptide ABC transporter permease [Spiroplasma sp. TIUS-1]|uniref:oligopeptide ABC transporter permease OppB n=1 Tax=Spiroplasma sp. TIUS-1 TaxID=216963 RepID=UPI001398667F|nr:oligopeptide ABC transporter permease OppB [Spiroplasma sp. TIUS-1]QHX36090.1 oligopeptide ABC transporter permease [Spiroplasma sp. TIUS-1]